jgi:hypothetical protein
MKEKLLELAKLNEQKAEVFMTFARENRSNGDKAELASMALLPTLLKKPPSL